MLIPFSKIQKGQIFQERYGGAKFMKINLVFSDSAHSSIHNAVCLKTGDTVYFTDRARVKVINF